MVRKQQRAVRMPRWRLSMVLGLIVFVVGGHLLCIALDRQYWPFSQYAMYSGLRHGPWVSRTRLYGVSSGEEFPLDSKVHLPPFSSTRFVYALRALQRMSARGPRGRARFDTAAQWFLRRYEESRQAGRHNDPPLDEIRVYNVYWKMDEWARNAAQPSRRRLIQSFVFRRRQGS